MVDVNSETIYNKDVSKEARLDIILGLPASGKFSTLADSICDFLFRKCIKEREGRENGRHKILGDQGSGRGSRGNDQHSSAIHQKPQKRIQQTIEGGEVRNTQQFVFPLQNAGNHGDVYRGSTESVKQDGHQEALSMAKRFQIAREDASRQNAKLQSSQQPEREVR